TFTFNVTAVIDPPVLDLAPANSSADWAATFTEGGAAVAFAGSGTSLSDVDSSALSTLTVTYNTVNFPDNPSGRILLMDGLTTAATIASLGTLPANATPVSFTLDGVGYEYTVSASSTLRTITFRGSGGGSMTLARAETLLDALRYDNPADAPVTGNNRVFTIRATDDAGTGSTDRTFTVTVNATNDAPQITGTGAFVLTSVNEDVTSPAGTSVATLLGSRVTDPDSPTAAQGIAIIAADNTNGTWQYSTDTGASWSDLGSPNDSNARLLTSNASNLLRFVPKAQWNGTVASGLTFRAWDTTAGSSGSVSAALSVGGTTAFSTETGVVSVTVDSVNDAPTGTDGRVTILEDTAYTFSLGDFGFTDPQDNAAPNLLAAVRITTLPSASGGTLQRFNGTAYVAVTAGQEISRADILAGWLRFLPAAQLNGSAAAQFTFQVRDDGGTASGGVDLDASPHTLTLDITAVNDPPTAQAFTVTTLEDTPYVFSTLDFTGAGGFADATDANTGALAGIVITSLPDAAQGTLWLNGTALASVPGPGISVSAAELAAGALSFVPAPNSSTPTGQTPTGFGIRVRDDQGTAGGGQDLSVSSYTVSVRVTAVNDAPVLLGAGSMRAWEASSPEASYTPVSELVAGYTAADPEGDPVGVAVVGVDTSRGTWEYQLAGTSAWSSLAGASDAAARLLPQDALIRFRPADSAWAGRLPAGLTLRAWERTSGLAGDTGDATVNGGSSVFSSATAFVSIRVNLANQAPVLTGANVLQPVLEDVSSAANTGTRVRDLVRGQDPEGAWLGIAIIGTDTSKGAWSYRLPGSSGWLPVGSRSDASRLLLSFDAFVRFEPQADFNGTVVGGLGFR
ncbi:MAG: hypothetical protein ACKO5J_13350, partial [Rubrivivax sp.]